MRCRARHANGRTTDFFARAGASRVEFPSASGDRISSESSADGCRMPRIVDVTIDADDTSVAPSMIAGPAILPARPRGVNMHALGKRLRAPIVAAAAILFLAAPARAQLAP